MRIQLEVIPNRCIGRNLHSYDILSKGKWEEISHQIRGKKICCCCEKRFSVEELHAHEIWEFDANEGIQRLERIIAVCEKCHKVIHYHFLLNSRRLSDRDAFIAKAHYMEVNNCTERDFERGLDKALCRYRLLNRFEGEWKMDISFVLKAEYLLYRDVNLENLEKAAPGSRAFLKSYENQVLLEFNNMPKECLIDHADTYFRNHLSVPCIICGDRPRVLHNYYELRMKHGCPEIVLAGVRQICPICRKTIYYGANQHFKRFRNTTKHYMKINNCSYEEYKTRVKTSKTAMIIAKASNPYVYLKIPPLPREEFLELCDSIRKHGGIFDDERMQWCFRPVKYLWKFKDFL